MKLKNSATIAGAVIAASIVLILQPHNHPTGTNGPVVTPTDNWITNVGPPGTGVPTLITEP